MAIELESSTARTKADPGEALGIVISIVTPHGVLRIVPQVNQTVSGLIARLEAQVKPGEKEPVVSLRGVAVEPA
jgi:hypothetical protein